MKKISISILAVLSLIATASCNKEQFAETSSTTDAALVVSASQDEDSKLYLTEGGKTSTLKWAANDKLIGFNTAGDKYVSDARGGSRVSTTANFQFGQWSGTPAYFMYNFDGSGSTEYADAFLQDGNIIAKVADLQKPVDSGVSICRWGPVTVGVAVKGGTPDEPVYTTSPKNVTGFIKVAFCNSKIQSLSLSSKEGIDLAGKISISTSSVDAGEPVATVLEGKKTITLIPTNSAGHDEDSAEEGVKVKCFNAGTGNGYYISVLPGEFTPVLTFTDNLGRTVTKTASSPITVTRSGMYDLKIADASVVFDESLKLPQTLTFTLGKEWNFKETAPVEGQYGNQKAGNAAKKYYGETYTYNYTDASTGFQGTYPFLFCKHYKTEDDTHGYYYDSSKGIVFILSEACLTLPTIPNYSLSEVEMTCNANSKLQDVFGPTDNAGNVLHQFAGGASTDTYKLTGTVVGKQYYLYFDEGSDITISDLKLTYIKASTLEPVVLGFDYLLEDKGNFVNPFSGLSGTMAGSSDVTFTFAGYQFVPNSGSKWCWNKSYGLMINCDGVSAPLWLKLPKIAGYKLSKVKLGTTQSSKKYQISYAEAPVSTVDDMTVVAEATLTESVTTLVLNDIYNPAKDYYYVVKTTNGGACKFLLTYRPL